MTRTSRSFSSITLLASLAIGCCLSTLRAQQTAPHIGYFFPAGVQRGDQKEIFVGGQFLDGVDEVLIGGSQADREGITFEIIGLDKPLSGKIYNETRMKLQALQARARELQKKNKITYMQAYQRLVKEMGLDEDLLNEFIEQRKRENDPKRQLNPQLSETVTLKVTCDKNVKPGLRELRLVTTRGITNPMKFCIGEYPEQKELEPNDRTPGGSATASLPMVINGQIMPGDVDRFRFKATEGQHLVVAASARELIPYLADAVPGWFQATLALYDSDGNEVAYTDDYRFQPDPVLFYEVEQDDEYVLEIKDSIYRGREDFVYRITLGEIPFVTGAFPLGGRDRDQSTVQLVGWNLTRDQLKLDSWQKLLGVNTIEVSGDGQSVNRIQFAVDRLPERIEAEPNNTPDQAQKLDLPIIVNGHIDQVGDADRFAFEAKAGDQIVAEVLARKINSPLDSMLVLYGPDGKQIALNDDYAEEKEGHIQGTGMVTHHADSMIAITLPQSGTYQVRLTDAQYQGGYAFAYRLRLSPRRPDFELRATPCSVNTSPNSTVPMTIHALRQDGFDGPIAIQLKDAPTGFKIQGGLIPKGQDQVRVTLTAGPTALDEPLQLKIEGTATILGREVRHQAVAAEDMMQAFLYRHLVPADQLMVFTFPKPRFRNPFQTTTDTPVKIQVGNKATVRLTLPAASLKSSYLVSLLPELRFALNNPPEGLTVEKTIAKDDGIEIIVKADPETTKPGISGNLIFDILRETTTMTGADKKTPVVRRSPLGILHAIPFEIVE